MLPDSAARMMSAEHWRTGQYSFCPCAAAVLERLPVQQHFDGVRKQSLLVVSSTVSRQLADLRDVMRDGGRHAGCQNRFALWHTVPLGWLFLLLFAAAPPPRVQGAGFPSPRCRPASGTLGLGTCTGAATLAAMTLSFDHTGCWHVRARIVCTLTIAHGMQMVGNNDAMRTLWEHSEPRAPP